MTDNVLSLTRPCCCCREALQPEVLEECILSATIKHLSLSDIVHHLATIQEQQADDFWLLSNIMEEVYRRFDALLRQLQVHFHSVCVVVLVAHHHLPIDVISIS